MNISKNRFVDLIDLHLKNALSKYKQAKKDRKSLYETEFYISEDSFSAFFEIQMQAELVEAYANTIVKNGSISKVDEALDKLNNEGLFKNKDFIQWYIENEGNYPKLYAYIDTLDWLRYRLMDYIEFDFQERVDSIITK